MTWTPDGREGDPRATEAGPRDSAGGSGRSHRRRSTHQPGYEARHSQPRPSQRSRATSAGPSAGQSAGRSAGSAAPRGTDYVDADVPAAARAPDDYRRPPPRRADSAWTRIPLRAPDGPLSARVDPTGAGGPNRAGRYAEARYTDPVYVSAAQHDGDPRADEPGRGADRPAARPDPPVTRMRRFAKDFGWRAYAIPVLTVATFICLMDVARGTSGEDTSAAASHRTQAAEFTVAATTAPPAAPPPTTAAPETYVEEGAGTLSIVAGSSEVYGSGPLRTFIIEVEDGIDQDGAAFAAEVEKTLSDPRSWGAGGQFSFQRVDTTDDYDFRVALVSPAHVESLCPGYGTEGYTSCRYQDRAVINLARWVTAVPDYAGDLATYRPYVINHEVGHWFGHQHEQCPGEGLLAPVMQQQTLGLNGCAKNAWPYPNGPDVDPANPNV